ncbi:SDR family NAD(P)-dependent oxidoreductase [Aureimonas ureilytica]|uniref:SDR family NAD(P)-dependent oxidoreductase n=1 Tax=Aureimonas ureilytica TaxID=401562 RepID=UPI0009EAEC47|nr:SDR family oxidoreductase [Aureimonas ureilytica]
MVLQLEGKTAFVTGAGSGIGRSVAISLSRAGAAVILVGRRPKELEETRALLHKGVDKHIVAPANVTSENEIANVIRNSPPLDIAVNVAGLVYSGLLEEMSIDTFSRTFDVNVLGLWVCLKHQILAMKAHNGGSIVNIGSNIGAKATRPGLGAYAASKAAVSSLSRTAALEGVSHGIRVNCLCPGPVDTPLSYRPGEDRAARDARIASTNPSKRVASTEEIAKAVLWLVSSDASYIVGQDILIDGGASI